MDKEEEDDISDESPLFRALSLCPIGLRRRKQILLFSDLLHNCESDLRRIT